MCARIRARYSLVEGKGFVSDHLRFRDHLGLPACKTPQAAAVRATRCNQLFALCPPPALSSAPGPLAAHVSARALSDSLVVDQARRRRLPGPGPTSPFE